MFQVVPIMWCFMSKKNHAAYAVIWSFIKKDFPLFKPPVIVCDFEEALIKSLKEAFEGSRIYGCHFHFSQVRLFYK